MYVFVGDITYMVKHFGGTEQIHSGSLEILDICQNIIHELFSVNTKIVYYLQNFCIICTSLTLPDHFISFIF